MSKLNKEAINEITHLLNEVKDVVRLCGEFGIVITSDSWSATSFSNDENILRWERENFEKFNEISYGDKFFIGGNICTGYEHEYKNKTIIAPKELAEVEGDIFENYLYSIINSTPSKHFELELVDEYGLTDNCGWEHWLIIEATVQKSALSENKTKRLIQQIREEEDSIIELSGSPIEKNPSHDKDWEEIGLRPQGEFAYMVEFFSASLVCQDDDDYIGCFSEHDYNGKYIRDAMKLINNVEQRAEELANKYADKGVKVTINDFNEGCQYGMAVYVWIPYQ